MSIPIVQTAAEIIAAATPEKPADSVMRDVLRKKGAFLFDEGRDIVHAVFAYYRWFGWLDSQAALEARIAEAGRLALRFKHDPGSFPDLSAAVPAWTNECLEVTPQWLARLQSEPTLWLRARTDAVLDVMKQIFDTVEGPFPTSMEYQGQADLFRSPEFHDGMFELQDINSQAVGWICRPQPGETWWDACAGEGGKTMHLSDLMQNKGLIWATDKAEWRLKQLKRRAGRAHCFNYRSKVWLGAGTLPTKTRFDGVLLDAPCSGLGTWQRNPHARWTTQLNDVQELAALQKSLLNQACASVKPGGRLIYAVCTLSKQETTEVAAEFSLAHPDFIPAPFAHPYDSKEPESAQVTLWPQHSRGNGMFIAVWTKKS